MDLNFSDAGCASTQTHFISLMFASNFCSKFYAIRCQGLPDLKEKIQFLISLCYVRCLLEFSGGVVSMTVHVDPVLNPNFCICVHRFTHTPNRNLRQWGPMTVRLSFETLKDMSENGTRWEAPWVWIVPSLEYIALMLDLFYQPAVRPQKSLLASLNLSFFIWKYQIIISSLATSRFHCNHRKTWYTWKRMAHSKRYRPKVSGL